MTQESRNNWEASGGNLDRLDVLHNSVIEKGDYISMDDHGWVH